MTSDYLEFAHRLADAAGTAIMPHYRTRLVPEDKSAGGRFDPVTVADRAAEQVMRDLITQHYPSHGIIGEEFGSERVDAEFVWVLDPVDGTKSFMCGIPLWGTLIGLLHRGRPFLGVSEQPFLRERFWGDGKEAFGSGPLGTRKLETRRPVTLPNAIVYAGSTVVTVPALQDRLLLLTNSVRMVRYGADCYDTAMLAEGHIDTIIQTGLDIYDIAATVPIIEGAGGVVTGLDGGPAIHASTIVASGDPALHAAILPLLQPQTP